jgi:hypothetical protein
MAIGKVEGESDHRCRVEVPDLQGGAVVVAAGVGRHRVGQLRRGVESAA